MKPSSDVNMYETSSLMPSSLAVHPGLIVCLVCRDGRDRGRDDA